MADSQTRHRNGLAVIAALAVVFFTLLGLIIVKSDDDDDLSKLPRSETLSVVPVRIRIRTEPDARAAVIATATAGEQLTMVEDRGAWIRVQNTEGLAGWAERANLERTAEQKRRLARDTAIRRLPPLKGIATARAPLYAGPGIFYPLVGELVKGKDVRVYTRNHDFFAIDRGESVAYVDVDAVDISASGRQLVVRTPAEPSSTTEPVAAAEPPPSEIPIPQEIPRQPAPQPYERTTGVYTAVPAGGTHPEEIDRVVPRYPSRARDRNVEGAVVVRGIVRRDGTIDNVEVIKDLPYGLGDEARRAVSRWRFRPAMYQGEPIDVYYTVTVNFRLR